MPCNLNLAPLLCSNYLVTANLHSLQLLMWQHRLSVEVQRHPMAATFSTQRGACPELPTAFTPSAVPTLLPPEGHPNRAGGSRVFIQGHPGLHARPLLLQKLYKAWYYKIY